MKHRKVLVPPMWAVGLFSILGIYAVSLIYNAVVHGGWVAGVVGAALLAASLYMTANPLAASMWKHRETKLAKHTDEK